MKKLLALLWLASIAQTPSIYSARDFRYLNDLPEYSGVRYECEQLERSWLFKNKKEKACDFLDNEINDFVITIRSHVYVAKNKKDWIDSVSTLAKLTRDVSAKLADNDYHNQIQEAVRTIVPEATDKIVTAECAMLIELTGKAVKQELGK